MPTLFTCPSQISIPAFLNFSRITFSPTITQVRCQTLGMRKWIIFLGCAPLTAKNTKGKHKKQPLSQNAYKKKWYFDKICKRKKIFQNEVCFISCILLTNYFVISFIETGVHLQMTVTYQLIWILLTPVEKCCSGGLKAHVGLQWFLIAPGKLN